MGNYFGGYTAATLRGILVIFILLPILTLTKQWQPFNLAKNLKYFVGAAATAALVWGPLYYAILHAGIGLALTVNYACIVIGLFLLGWLFDGEKLTKDKIISASLGIFGLGLVFLPGTNKIPVLALLAAIISGFATSANILVTKKMPYKSGQTTFSVWFASVFANLIMLFVVNEKVPPIALNDKWLYIIIFSLATIASTWLLAKGVKLVEAGVAGLLGLLEIVFGVLFGVVFFHERPGVTALVGVIVIIVAAAIPYIKDFNLQRGTLEQ